MNFLIFCLAFPSLIFKAYSQCFDKDPASSLCNLCSFDYYLDINATLIQNKPFIINQCQLKQKEVLNLTYYVNSDKQCNYNDICDGSSLSPYENLYQLFTDIMNRTKNFIKSNIVIYLLGNSPHYLSEGFTTKENNYIFRRYYLNITMQPLYCELENLVGCMKSPDEKTTLNFKKDSLFFFINYSFKIKNIIFTSIDMNLYYSSLDYPNITICNDSNLMNESQEPLLKQCFINSKQIEIDKYNPYGLFNLEFVIDCSFCEAPSFYLENCQIEDFFSFFIMGPNYISFINILKPYIASIYVEKTQFQNVFFGKGIISTNLNTDFYYISLSNYDYTFYLANKALILEISIDESNFTKYNDFSLSGGENGMFYFQFDNVFSLFTNISFTRADFTFIDQSKFSSAFTMISMNKLHSSSIFVMDNCNFLSNKLYYFITLSTKIQTFILKNNFFQRNRNMAFDLTNSFPIFISNIITDHLLELPLIILKKCEILIKDCIMTNFSMPSASSITILIRLDYFVSTNIFSIYTCTSNYTFDKIKLQNFSFSHSKNVGLIQTKYTLRELFIEDSIFDEIDISKQNNMVYTNVENLVQIKSTKFNAITAYYLFSHDYCRNRTYDNVSFTNSDSLFLKSLSVKTDYHCMNIFIKDTIFENLSIYTTTQIDFLKVNINYITDALDCVLLNTSFDNITFINKPGNLAFLSHCSYVWIANITLHDINQASFLYLFNHNKVPTDSEQVKPYVNISNIYLFNNWNMIYFIYLETMFYVYIQKSKFSSTETFQNKWVITSNCFPNCFIVIEDCIFEGISSFLVGAIYLTYQNIHQILIRNCTFVENKGNGQGAADIQLNLQEKVLNLENPMANFQSRSTQFSFTPIKNYSFVYENIMNSFDFFQVWNNSKSTFGVHFCNFLKSKGISINLNIGNELFTSDCNFINIESSFSIIFIDKMAKMSVFSSIFSNCSSNENGGVSILSDSSTAYFYNNTIKVMSIKGKGGVIYMNFAVLIFRMNVLYNISALEGGVINAFNSQIFVYDTMVQDSFVKGRGTFIYAKKSQITVNNSKFINSYSLVQGIFSFEFMEKIVVKHSIFENNHVLRGLIYIIGSKNYQYYFENVTFVKNYADVGACFYLNDGNIIINGSQFYDNWSPNSLFKCYSSFSQFTLGLMNCNLQNNSALESFSDFLQGLIDLGNLTIKNNNFKENMMLFTSCKISLNNSIIEFHSKDNDTKITPNFLLYTKFSSLYIENVTINMQWSYSGIYCDSNLENIVTNTMFSRLKSKKGSAINILSSHLLNISYCNFSENIGGSIYIEDTNLQSNFNYFTNNTGLTYPDIYCFNRILVLKAFANLVSTFFINIKGASFSIENYLNFSSYNGEFLSTENEDIKLTSPSFIITNTKNIEIKYCRFKNLKNASAILFLNTKISNFDQLTIENSSFENCSTSYSGGAITITGAYKISIKKSIFLNNFAYFEGGAINIDCNEIICSTSNISNNIFQNNFALQSGGALKSNLGLSSNPLAQNIFINNKASVGDDFITNPHWFFVTNDSDKLISNTNLTLENNLFEILIASGQIFQLYICIFDQNDYFLKTLNEGGIQISTDDDSLIKIINGQVLIVNGVANLDNLIIIGKPGSNTTVIISYINQNLRLNYTMRIYFRMCKRGEIYLNLQCILCESFVYSLDDSPTVSKKESCDICPLNADCPGGSLIIPHKNYWRLNENSTIILPCVSIYSCPPQYDYYVIDNNSSYQITYNLSKTFEYHCSIGTYGNLCSNCNEYYGKDGDKNCIKCSDNKLNYLKYVIFLMASLSFLVYQSYVAVNFNHVSSQQRSLMKLLINHNYYLTFTATFSFKITNEIKEVIDADNKYGTVIPQEIANFDCFLTGYIDKENMEVNKILLFSLFPILICVLLVLIRLSLLRISFLVYKKRQLKEENTKNTNLKAQETKTIVFASIIVVFYAFYSRLILNAFSLLKCINLDDSNRRFLAVDPNIQCWTYESVHPTLLISIFLPNLLIWCIGWPVFLYMILIVKRMKEIKTIKNTLSKRKKFTFEGKSKDFLNIDSKKSTEKKLSSFFGSISRRKHSENQTQTKILISEKQSEEIFQKNVLFYFLTIDYKHNFYYWESFFYLTNLLITTVNTIEDHIGYLSQIGLLTFIYFIMLLLNEKLKPFRYDYVNNIASFSYTCMILTIVFLLMSRQGSSFFFQEALYTSCMILINAIFYVVWIGLFANLIFKNQIKEFFNDIVNFFKKKLKKHKASKISPIKEVIEENDRNKNTKQVKRINFNH